MYCANCNQERFLKCGELPQSIRLCESDIPHELITMLESIPEEYRGGEYSKIVIMRLDEKSDEWYAFLCKTEFYIDTMSDCNINDLKLADVLNLISHYGIKVEIRYDYFREYD